MGNHTVFLLIAAAVCLVIPSNGSIFSDSFPKCEVDDNNCIAKSLALLMKHSTKYPHLGVPNLTPFRFPLPIEHQSIKLTPWLTSKAYSPNVTADGMDEIVIQEVSGFQPCQSVKEIQLKTLIPKLTLHMNTVAEWKIALLSFIPRGSITVNLENAEVSVNLKIDTVQRNGNDYMIITDTTTLSTDASYFNVKHKYDNVASVISSTVEGLVNSNWKTFKRMLDRNINRFVADAFQKSILQAIFNKISVQEFCSEMFYVRTPLIGYDC